MKYIHYIMATVGMCIICNASADGRAHVEYKKPHTSEEALIQKQLRSSTVNDSAIDVMNDTFIFPQDFTIVYGADDGPLYDPQQNTIFIPYEFITEVHKRFSHARYSDSGVSVKEATHDALTHTLFHEFAHALIAMHHIPVAGKEEDAADALATLLLIELFENGGEMALSAADLFNLESGDREQFEEADFWDEHSLDEQRYYSLLCFVYGSAPDTYDYIVDDGILGTDRAEQCQDEYALMARSWFTLLDPYMRK